MAPKPSTAKVRPLELTDSVEEITDLLHRSYLRNAQAGLRFLATHQDSSVTQERLAAGPSFVAELDGKIVGVVTLRFDIERPYGDYDPSHPIASFGQFGVDPECRGLRIGDLLLEQVERAAREAGCQELTLDTAQPATDLIVYYQRRGFMIVGQADWRPTTNYESWIMVKKLD